jgi:E3 ubiquitin-protein ligase HERC2
LLYGVQDNLGLPRKIEALEGVRIVDGAAGGAHTLLLSAKGTLYAFGRGRNGQLGQPIASASYKTTPVEVSMPAPIVSISAGENHSLAIVKS